MSAAGISLKERVGALMGEAHSDLARLVAIPSVSDPSYGDVAELDRAAMAVGALYEDIGFSVETRRTADGSLTVIGRSEPASDAATILLYTHYDVQPPGDVEGWASPPFELTQRDGRWFGRGAADCKGNLVALSTGIRAFLAARGSLKLNLAIVCEGAEETAAGGLERLILSEPDRWGADAVFILDVGNAALGVPTLTTSLRGYVDLVVNVDTMELPVHSGMYAGAAPDALAALIRMLSSLRDAVGDTVIAGLASHGSWEGEPWSEASFLRAASVLEGVRAVGSGNVADMLWARPAVTITGIDCPGVAGAVGAISSRASARLNLRVPPGVDSRFAQQALMGHLQRVAPWGAKIDFVQGGVSDGFLAPTEGPIVTELGSAMEEAFGHELMTFGQGAGIPLSNALRSAAPHAEFALFGVEEPGCAIHAPNESVHPDELARTALAIALFLDRMVV